jgi:hypothetical protein
VAVGLDEQENRSMSERTSERTTDEIIDEWMDGGRDLDALCIQVDLGEAIARRRCALDGIEWDDCWDENPAGEVETRIIEANDALAALIEAGLLRSEWYRYDEATHEVKAADRGPNGADR